MKEYMRLWYYAKPDQMEEHKFTDDVAVCKATTKKEAMKIFAEYYGNMTAEDVGELAFRKNQNIIILTDY